jgi:DedD protein
MTKDKTQQQPTAGRRAFIQRVVGACILVAWLVVLLPFLLHQPHTENLSPRVDIPKAPSIDFTHLSQTPLPPPVELPKPEKEPQPTATAADKQAPSYPDQPQLNAQGIPQAWAIQLASFSQQANAQQLTERLGKQGFKSYIQQVDKPKVLYRVFVGPTLRQAEAHTIQQQILEKFQLKGLVVPFKPGE